MGCNAKLAASILCLLLSSAGSSQPLSLALVESPPMMGENLSELGVQSHIVKEAYELVGVQIDYKFYPPARTFELAQNGKVDGLVGWVYSGQRAKRFAYSAPIIKSPLVLFHHKQIPFDWETMEDLKGHTVGIVSKNFYGEAFHAAAAQGIFETEEVSLDAVNFRKLVIGRVTLFPYSVHSGYRVIKESLPSDKAQLITHHPKPIKSSEYHLLISKRNKKHRELIKQFDTGLKKLVNSGRYFEILKQHKMKLKESSVY